MLSPLEKLNRALRENRPEDFISPRHRELGMRPLHFGPGTSSWEWDATREQALNPFGYVAGGSLTVFADELMGSAIGSVLEEGELATTAELKISFLKPVAKGLVRGEGKVLRKGKRVAFVEATVRDARDEVVALVSSTWTIVAN
ncbi:MAG TPA: PaaI family thioesterase [Candidatus Binatia bacterium]|nr:PaaI family thioesterase [Candidatus Binatia bacterium]